MDEESKPDPDDERPPICPACGVTMGITVEEAGTTHYVCFECGFSDGLPFLRARADRSRIRASNA